MTLDEHNDAVRVMLGDLLRRQEYLETQLLEMSQRDSAERRVERAEDVARQARETRRGRRLGIASQVLEFMLLRSENKRETAEYALEWADALLEADLESERALARIAPDGKIP